MRFRAYDQRVFVNARRGHATAIQLVAGQEFVSSWIRRDDSRQAFVFVEQVDATVRVDRRRAVSAFDTFGPDGDAGFDVQARGHAFVIDHEHVVTDDQLRRTCRRRLSAGPRNVCVGDVSRSVRTNGK